MWRRAATGSVRWLARVWLEPAQHEVAPEREPLVRAAAEEQIHRSPGVRESLLGQRQQVVPEHPEELLGREVPAGEGRGPHALLERVRPDVEAEQVTEVRDYLVRDADRFQQGEQPLAVHRARRTRGNAPAR